MPKAKVIKLGRSVSLPSAPSGVVGEASVDSPAEEMVYPTLYLEWDKKYDLPESGTLTIKFHKKSETNRNPKDGGKQGQQVELDVLELSNIKADETAVDEKEEDPGEALDELAKKVVEADEEDPGDHEYR